MREEVSGLRRGLLIGLMTILIAPAASADLTAYLTLTINGQSIPGGVTLAGR